MSIGHHDASTKISSWQQAHALDALETVRAVLASTSFPVGELVVLVLWAVAAPLLAARCFRWEE